jgi:signal peptidase II
VFNIADCGVTVGAVILVVFGLFGGTEKGGVR